MTGVAVASLLAAVPALAEETLNDMRKDQLLYQEQLRMDNDQQAQPGKGADQHAIGETKANSGPGIQGAPDTRTGPSTKAPGDAADSAGSVSGPGSASTGASSGEDGSAVTQPSQDSSGVQGFPNTRTGPSTKGELDESSKAPSK
jgi:hypothetical protein